MASGPATNSGTNNEENPRASRFSGPGRRLGRLNDTHASSTTPNPRIALELKYALTPVTLVNLLETANSKLILVDCRNLESFKRRQIKLCSVNINSSNSSIIGPPEKFDSKGEFAKFLQESGSSILHFLNAPGHFGNVVVLDENSTTGDCSGTVKTFLDGLITWNHGTNTKMHILQGGFQVFATAFPNWVTSGDTENATASQRLYCTASSRSKNKFIDSLNLFLANLDEIIATTSELISLRKKRESLLQVRAAVIKEKEEKLSPYLESRIPEEMNCPVCLEVFRGEIFQCSNGHSICSDCCRNITNCPECRVEYREKVRNRALESIVANSLKVDCVYCHQSLELSQVRDHGKVCTCIVESDEVKRIDGEVKAIMHEINAKSAHLAARERNLVHKERSWNVRFGGNWADRVGPALLKKFIRLASSKKATISKLNGKLLTLALTNREEIPV